MKNSLLWLCASLIPGLAAAQALDKPAPETVSAPDITAEHTGFVLKLADGRVLRGTGMQGAVVHMAIEGGQVASIRLASIKPDEKDPDILRHDFQVQDDNGVWKPACEPNAYGETWGFPIALPLGHPGRENPITLTCASGAVGKCVRFGYKPWTPGPKGEDLTPYHAACVRMVRADYGGDGEAHTKNGTEIDVYDHIGVQSPTSMDDAKFAFEAGWAPQGAVCVAHTRWKDLLTLAQLQQHYPKLPAPAACTEKSASAKGAVLFNRSKP